MSRVFEALAKASEEKKQQAQTPAEKRDVTASEPLLPKAGTVAGEPGVNRTALESEILQMSRSISNGHKNWRERIEEIFFGWDLRRYTSYPIVALDKDSSASEQYKILREQIKRLRRDGGIKSFAITSPVKRDGKTTVAVNLSAVLALDYEEEVLLIDGDLRAPGVHNYFNAESSPGLSDYLGSQSNGGIKGLVQETFLPGLRILPAGKPSAVASELLAKEKMSHVMEEIRSEFPQHQIIIDSPPVLSTPDPMVLARQVDGVLMVVRAGKTPRDYLMKALQSLNSSKLMGIVLNGADLGISSKYYYYSTNSAS